MSSRYAGSYELLVNVVVCVGAGFAGATCIATFVSFLVAFRAEPLPAFRH